MIKAKSLGRGLSALMGENLDVDELDDNDLKQILIENIQSNPDQPRTVFTSIELEELASSISQNGILQPILIKPIGTNKYQIIAGERRWRAAKIAGLASMPAIIKDISAREVLEIALIENIQRENLSSLEEAESYKKLINEYQYTQDRMAEIVSKSRSHVANLLRLLNLPEKVKNYLNQNLISLGHAKLLVNQADAENLVELIVNNNLNVRETEDLIREQNGFTKNSRTNKATSYQKNNTGVVAKNEDILALENHLGEALGMLVKIDSFTNGGSKIIVHCETLEQLDNIVQKLSGSIAII